MVRCNFSANLKGHLTVLKELLPLYTVMAVEDTVEATSYNSIDAANAGNDSASRPAVRSVAYRLCACGRQRSVTRLAALYRNSNSGTCSITPHSAASLKYSANPFLHSASSV